MNTPNIDAFADQKRAEKLPGLGPLVVHKRTPSLNPINLGALPPIAPREEKSPEQPPRREVRMGIPRGVPGASPCSTVCFGIFSDPVCSGGLNYGSVSYFSGNIFRGDLSSQVIMGSQIIERVEASDFLSPSP